MLTRRIALLATLAAPVTLGGCVDMFDFPTMTQPGVPSGTITVVNQTNTNLLDIRATDRFDARGRMQGPFTDNLMAPRQTIPPGGSFSTPASQGLWMVRVLSGSGSFFGWNNEHFVPVTVRPGANSTVTIR